MAAEAIIVMDFEHSSERSLGPDTWGSEQSLTAESSFSLGDAVMRLDFLYASPLLWGSLDFFLGGLDSWCIFFWHWFDYCEFGDLPGERELLYDILNFDTVAHELPLNLRWAGWGFWMMGHCPPFQKKAVAGMDQNFGSELVTEKLELQKLILKPKAFTLMSTIFVSRKTPILRGNWWPARGNLPLGTLDIMSELQAWL